VQPPSRSVILTLTARDNPVSLALRSKRCKLDLPGFKNLEGLHSVLFAVTSWVGKIRDVFWLKTSKITYQAEF